MAMSCTVTKRVHRSGYHVVWHTHREVQNSVPLDHMDFENQVNQLEKLGDPHGSEEVNNPTETILNNEVTVQNPNADDAPKGEQSSTPSSDRLTQQRDSKKLAPLISRPTRQFNRVKENNQTLFWRVDPDTLTMLGIILMSVGGVILLGALFMYLGAYSGNGDGGWLYFFLNLFSLSGWFWLLIFLIILILFFYLIFLLIEFVLGGPLIALFIGIGLLGFGLFLYILGRNRAE